MAGGLAASSRRGGGGRRSARRSRLSEINVTPFVDVMLVLLIVFMVTAPLLTVAIPVELPRTEAKQSSTDNEPLTISIRSDGVIFLQDQQVTAEELVPHLRALSHEGYDRQIFIRGDSHTQYGVMAQLLASVSTGGFRHLQLVTDTMDASHRAASPAGSQ